METIEPCDVSAAHLRARYKIHALVDIEGRPVNLRLIGGQVASCTEFDALTDVCAA